MAKLGIFSSWIENDLSFSRSSQNDDFSSQKNQFLMPSHEGEWPYWSMLLNEKPILKDNN